MNFIAKGKWAIVLLVPPTASSKQRTALIAQENDGTQVSFNNKGML